MNNLSTASRPHDALASLVVNIPNSLQQSPIFSNSLSNVLSPHNGHQHLQFSSGHKLFPDQNSPTPSSRVQETVLTLQAYSPPESIPSEPRNRIAIVRGKRPDSQTCFWGLIQASRPYAIHGIDLDFEEWVQRASGYLKTIQVSACR